MDFKFNPSTLHCIIATLKYFYLEPVSSSYSIGILSISVQTAVKLLSSFLIFMSPTCGVYLLALRVIFHVILCPLDPFSLPFMSFLLQLCNNCM